MKLLTKSVRESLPPLHSTKTHPDPLAVVKFFTPWAGSTWYAIEFDGEDCFFGVVDGFERQLGYFSLTELEAIRGPSGLPIERDRHFEPIPLSRLL